MTTPDELRRNLIWGLEALAELSQEDQLLTEWRTEAETLLSGYPPLARLQQADHVDLGQLQVQFAAVLLAAKWLFMRVQQHPSISEQRKYSLRVILRHFV